jgi:hypothetical protein
MRISLLRRLGMDGATGWGAAAQAGQSPTGGSEAPHFRHLDTGFLRTFNGGCYRLGAT